MNVVHHPEPLTAAVATDQSATRTLGKPVEIRLDTGYNRLLKAGSRWTQVGRVSQGTVYKPNGDIFTLEGAHVHEAYLVIMEGHLVGFYLPVESSFSPLKQKVSLTFSE